MTSAQMLSILMSMGFAMAFTAVLRKFFTKPDGSCPIDGKWVYAVALVFGVSGKLLAYYGAKIPPVVWEVMEPVIATVLAVGAVEKFGTKSKPNVVNIGPAPVKIVGTDGSPIDKAKLALGALMVIGAGVLFTHAAGCWAAAPACKVVDAAHDACVVFNYVDANGQKQTISMNREEAREMAMLLAAKRAAPHAPASSASAGAGK